VKNNHRFLPHIRKAMVTEDIM